jgi:nucleotide-binding universal stress UspA family protein
MAGGIVRMADSGWYDHCVGAACRRGLVMGRIVVGVDGSACGDRALHWAVREAELWAADVELLHGYVVHPHAAMLGTSDRARAEARMDEIVRRNEAVLERARWSPTVAPLIAGPTSALLDAGEDADLIVVGSRGLGGFHELFLGATSYRTAAHASVPVAVIRGARESVSLDGSPSVVVGVDGSRAGRRALRWALDEAARRAVDVTVVHAYDSTDLSQSTVMSEPQLERYFRRIHDDAVAVVDDALARAEVAGGIAVQRVVTRGSPAAVLLDRAGPDRLLVVGTRGRGALGRMVFGSVSHQCLHHATGPVVVVP